MPPAHGTHALCRRPPQPPARAPRSCARRRPVATAAAPPRGGGEPSGVGGGGAERQGPSWPEGEAPVVVLAGWLGAPERPFLKYVDLWRERLGAAAVVQARPNPAALILPPVGAASAARAAARVVDAAAAAPRAPLLLHLFSGGGYLYAGLLLLALRRSGDLAAISDRVAGVVLDSSPAYVTADVTSRALLAAALREPAEGVGERHPRLLAAVRGGVGAYFSLPAMRRRLEETEAAWRELTPPCPKLYLYSEADALVDPWTIQNHMQSEAVRGSRIYAHKWRDTPHVEHYRLHPDQYARIVGGFASEAVVWWRAERAAAAGGSDDGSVNGGDLLDGGGRSSSAGSSSEWGAGSLSGSVRSNSSE